MNPSIPSTHTRGYFLTFEGIEGSGKSTQLRRLAARLAARGIPHVVTREPGGTPLADQIRSLLLSPRDEAVFPETELLLYEAARAQHVRSAVLPALEAGKAVLCDRFHDATTAYQAHARGLDAGTVELLNRFASGGLLPDLTLLFDLPPETGFARIAGRSRGADRMERESLAFHRRVREGYLRLLDAHPGRIVRIDASLPEEEVFLQLLSTVKERFGW
ncbi:MAG: dTMP kinase [Thermodesulfobacteriota bacterium]